MNNEWNILNDISQLEQIQNDSNNRKQVLFKHNTACGISRYAYKKLENNWIYSENDFDFYYLDILNFQSISDAISVKWGITHQSPQIIVMDKEKVIYECSHHKISFEDLKQNI